MRRKLEIPKYEKIGTMKSLDIASALSTPETKGFQLINSEIAT